MKQLAKKVAIAVAALAITGGLATPAMAEKPDQNERPCKGNSKHAGPAGGGACPHPHP